MKELKEVLLEQLLEACHELEEFGEARAISIDEKTKEVIIAFRYDDPENNGNNTLFCNY
jgi:hypothetical protein